MTFQQELNSWKSPPALRTAATLEIGAKAPSSSKLQLPDPNGKPTIITFLRHCGCPFAEKTFRQIREVSDKNKDVNFVAVSHSDVESTEKWVIAVGGEWDVTVIVDSERDLYSQWALGVASFYHVLNPFSLYSAWLLGKQENIWNKPTESGSRWQLSGSFATDRNGVVRWAKVSKAADDIPDFHEAVKAVGHT